MQTLHQSSQRNFGGNTLVAVKAVYIAQNTTPPVLCGVCGFDQFIKALLPIQHCESVISKYCGNIDYRIYPIVGLRLLLDGS